MRVQSIALLLLLSLACQKAPAQSANQQAAGTSGTPAATTPAAAPAQSGSPAEGDQPPGARGDAQQQAPVKPVPAQLPEVLARVNGEPIDRAEFERALHNIEARAGGTVPAEQRDRVYRGVLDQLVTMHVLMQESKARNVAVTDADVDARIEQVKKQFPSEQEFTKALESRKMDLPSLRAEARSEIAVSKMVEAAVAPQIKIQESDIKEFYDKNPKEFEQPERFRASHILVRVEPNATEAQKKEARAKIEDVLQQVRKGGDFAALAKQHSQDGSAANGGDLNYFGRGQMVPAFEQAAAALKVGEVSGVVETQFGFHVIKLTDKQGPRTVPLAEVSPRIGQFLMMRAQQQKAGQFVEQLKAKSKIEILM